jgi:two-component system LytT family sensor kinase
MTTAPHMPTRRWPLTVRLIPLFAVIGVLEFLYRYLDDVARHRTGMLEHRLLEESTGIASALVIVPIVVVITQRVPWTRARWPRAALAHLGGAILYTVLHTTLMALSRAVISPLVGMGPYDYGDLLWRYPMEAANDDLAYAIAAALVYFFGREERARRAELAAVELRAQLAQAKLENLRLQLNPHFLFNALNAISSVMYEDVRRADAMLARLSEFLRTVLANDAQQVPLADELDVERMYVDVMTARLERALRFDVRVDPAARDAVVPFLVLQPLLENAIRHGMGGERNAIAITVDVGRDRDTTVISVTDDGVGFSNGEPSSGRGLANVESRLHALYDGAASFAIAGAPEGGTLATLRFPFRSAAAGTA